MHPRPSFQRAIEKNHFYSSNRLMLQSRAKDSTTFALCVWQSEDALFDGVKVRIYKPTERVAKAAKPSPGLIFFHAGGWVGGGIGNASCIALVFFIYFIVEKLLPARLNCFVYEFIFHTLCRLLPIVRSSICTGRRRVL